MSFRIPIHQGEKSLVIIELLRLLSSFEMTKYVSGEKNEV